MSSLISTLFPQEWSSYPPSAHTPDTPSPGCHVSVLLVVIVYSIMPPNNRSLTLFICQSQRSLYCIMWFCQKTKIHCLCYWQMGKSKAKQQNIMTDSEHTLWQFDRFFFSNWVFASSMSFSVVAPNPNKTNKQKVSMTLCDFITVCSAAICFVYNWIYLSLLSILVC